MRFCRSLLTDDSLGGIEARGSARRDLFDVGLVGTDADACSEMVGLDLNEWRHDFFALLNHVRAARVKAASGRRIYR